MRGDLDAKAVSAIRAWAADPVLFAKEVLGFTPDTWQAKALYSARDNPRTGLSACKGPGKSAVLAVAMWWFLSTQEDAQIIVLSITRDNLKDGLWKEMAFWQAKSVWLAKAFELTAERVCSREKVHKDTWWISARGFPQQADAAAQATTLAGFHGKAVMIVMDEMGDYPAGVVAAAEGIFANIGNNARLLAAWNPTDINGPAYRACTRDRHLWNIIHITGDPKDPNRSPRISMEWAQQLIDRWGRDHDYVRVNVLGEFPLGQSNSLIGLDTVQAAVRRQYAPADYLYAPRILGVDVARFGDDRSVLFPRQGRVAFTPKILRDLDTQAVAGHVALAIQAWKPHAVFIDVTGVGAGVVDRLLDLQFNVTGVEFGSRPLLQGTFRNKRDEMWWGLNEWFKEDGGAIPDITELIAELTAPTYKFTGDKFRLERKEEMKKRGLPSPDLADALALTFAMPVALPDASELVMANVLSPDFDLPRYDSMYRQNQDYDPFSEARR